MDVEPAAAGASTAAVGSSVKYITCGSTGGVPFPIGESATLRHLARSAGALHTLDMSRAHLSELPAELFAVLPYLKMLNVSENRLASLPGTLAEARHLETLVCRDNILTTIVVPPAVRKLDLSRNAVRGPLDFSGCTELVDLKCNGNWMRGLILPPRLETLSAAHNSIMKIVLPPTARFVSLGHNPLLSITIEGPDSQLEQLSIANTRLQEVELGPASKLRTLDLSRNHNLRGLPRDAVTRRTQSV